MCSTKTEWKIEITIESHGNVWKQPTRITWNFLSQTFYNFKQITAVQSFSHTNVYTELNFLFKSMAVPSDVVRHFKAIVFSFHTFRKFNECLHAVVQVNAKSEEKFKIHTATESEVK